MRTCGVESLIIITIKLLEFIIGEVDMNDEFMTWWTLVVLEFMTMILFVCWEFF